MLKKILALLLIICSLFIVSSCGGEAREEEAHEESEARVEESGSYYSKEDVAEYLSIYKKLPKNYITKKEAK